MSQVVITCVGADPSVPANAIVELISSTCPVANVRPLNDRATDVFIDGIELAGVRLSVENQVGSKLDALQIDRIYQLASSRRKRLFITDMDSTIIQCECIDELADVIGIKTRVAAITHSAMEGTIDFAGALRQRVEMLKGIPIRQLEAVYTERIRLSPGAESLMTALKKHGIRTVLVSGGFTFFAQRVALSLGFDYYYANELENIGGLLTGKILGPIVTKTTKLRLLHYHANALRAATDEVMSLGDGANDLPMLEGAGLGIAYRAKPVVEAAIVNRIRHTGLETVSLAAFG